MYHTIKQFVFFLMLVALFTPAEAQQFTEVAEQLGVADSVWQPGYGAQWVFVSDDERPDLYVSNTSHFISPYRPVDNRLYLNQTASNGGFVDAAADWGVDVHHGISLAPGWADFDLDGGLDLYVTNGYGLFGSPDVPNQFYRNDGITFTEVGATLGVDSIDWNYNSVTWGDYNGDGRPDVYVSNNDGPNLLFRNDGTRFTEVAIQNGMRHDYFEGDQNGGWIDYDRDGDLDLFLPVAHFASHLYQNNWPSENSFTDIAPELGLVIEKDLYHSAWGDYDNDGDWDVYISAKDTNLLYRNDLAESGQFTNTAIALGVADTALSRSASWADYDHDGDLDLLVINYSAPAHLYRNDLRTTGAFTDVSQPLGVALTNYSNFAGVWGDYDNDGDLDVYIPNSDTTNYLYRNNQDDDNYLKVRFLSANGSFSRQGSVVEVYRADTDSLVGIRQVDGGSGKWGCQKMYDVHFGLDGIAAFDLVIRSTLRANEQPFVLDKTTRPELGGVVPVEVGGFLEIRDTLDTFVSTESEPPPLPPQVTLLPAYPNPFNSVTILRYTLPAQRLVTLRIVDLRGAVVRTLVRRNQQAGTYTVPWDGTDRQGASVASGVYFVQLTSQPTFGQVVRRTRKLLLVK